MEMSRQERLESLVTQYAEVSEKSYAQQVVELAEKLYIHNDYIGLDACFDAAEQFVIKKFDWLVETRRSLSATHQEYGE